jgi:hypothetical protein
MKNRQKGFVISLAIAIIALILIGTGTYFFIRKSNPAPVACTMEAKLCPDGSYVGRTGPKCEFSACPGGSVGADGYVEGHITIGPFCPVERPGVPCPVPPEAYTSRSVVIFASDGYTEVKRFALDTNGNYKIVLAPGEYYAQIQPAGIGPGEKKFFSVVSSETITVDFNIDTGIR